MSLATRCTQCGTVFRVVQDQLKVSEGWVRCGRCDEVFNALAGLFDLERDSPPPAPVMAAEALVSTREQWRPSGNEGVPQPALPAPLSRSTSPHRQRDQRPFDRPQNHPTRPSQFASHTGFDSAYFQPVDGPHSAAAPLSTSTPVPLPVTRREAGEEWRAPAAEYAGRAADNDEGPVTSGDFADARFNTALLGDSDTAPPVDRPRSLVAGRDDHQAHAQASVAPSFVRKAESVEKWQSPLVRASLIMLALLLAIGLALQYVHHNRNMLAARSPGMESWLAQWCSIAGCKIEAPQNIADVHIESSSLTPAAAPASAPGAPSAVKLQVVLRNHGETKVALPSLDVTLTDSAGQLLSRRALSPTDFGISQAVLATGAESTLQVVLTTGERKAAGYTVDVFYP